MSATELQVVYADLLAASQTFKTQAPVFGAITENGFQAFQGVCDTPLYDAYQTFMQTLDAGQQAIAASIEGHGTKLKIAHDNYDRAETMTKMSMTGLYLALRDPNVIQ